MQTVRSYRPNKSQKESANRKAPARNYAAFADISNQNASEVAFLWLLRSRAVTSPVYFPVDIRELETRIESNLKGLSSTGETGWQACVDQLVFEEPGEIFTAAVVALRSRSAVRIKSVCELALKSPDMTKGLISALGWVEDELARFWIQRFLSVTDPKYRLLGIATCSVRREEPGKYFLNILQDPELSKYPAVHARAMRLIGELKRFELVPALNAAMESGEPSVRFWANWSAALLGNHAAVLNLIPYVMANTEYTDRAIKLVFSILPVNEARSFITEMAAKPDLIRSMIKAVAILGDPHAIPWLISQMDNKELSRLCGWAFSQISGIDLETSSLVVEQEEDVESGPTDDVDDENVELDEDEDYPWPHVVKIARLWKVHHQLLQPGLRYFQGQEITKQALANIFVNANQQQKELAALQRGILDRNTEFVNIKKREY